MNLRSKKARIPIAALGVTALIAGAGALTSPAFAVDALTLNTGGTTPVVANLGYGTTAAANAAYALKVTGATENVFLKVASAPTGGQLAYKKIASNGAATVGFSTASDDADEVQTVTITNGSVAEQYTLDFNGQTTTALNWDANAATVQAALVALSNIAAGDVSVVDLGGGAYTVSFGGALTGTNVAALIEGAQVGADTVTVGVTTDQAGGADASYKALSTVATTDYIYVTGNIPGTYTFRLFQDTNTNSQLDADDERSTALITLTVLDAGGPGTTTATTDDVAPVVAASTPVTLGLPITATITYTKSLSLADARGSGVAGGLAASLAARTYVDITATDAAAGAMTGIANSTENVASYTAATHTITSAIGTSGEAGSVAIRADLKTITTAADNTSYGSKTVTVLDNNVDDIDLAATEVDGAVDDAAGTVTAKTGTAAITYTATVDDTAGAGGVVVPSAVVYFTVAGTALNVAKLSTNGTAVDVSSTTSKVYSATTNSSGVASLTVTSNDPDAADTYTVDAASNSITGTPTLTTTYADAAADTIKTTSTAADLTPALTATSVTIKGKVLNQFGAAFAPAASDSQQVTVQIPDGSTAGFASIGSDGTFTYVYTPSTTPVAGDSVTFDYLYGALGDGDTTGGTIRWASATVAANVTLTTPADAATGLDLQSKAAPTNTGLALVGTVTDASLSGLAFKTVTFTGSEGVYFAADNDGTDATSTFTAVTDNAGAIQEAFVFFTKSGSATVTATSGTATDTATVTTDDSVDPYTIVVDDVTGAPGSTLILTGKVTDMFGNGVPDNTVGLSTGTSTVGSLSDATPETNAAGVFSTSFTAGSNQSGEVTLTATLYTTGGVIMTSSTVLEPNDAWKDVAGLTFADGDYQDTGTIIVTETKLTLAATGTLMGGGNALISGTFLPDTGIEIWSKASGAASYTLLDSVETDAEGEYGAAYGIKKTTSFLAKSAGLSSKVATTVVKSTVTLTGKSWSHNRATLKANGSPSAKGTLTFYRSVAGKDPVLAKMTSNSLGNGTKTVKLPKGTRSVYAKFKAPGTVTGTSKIIKIKVK
jgi:adhesin/invasin